MVVRPVQDAHFVLVIVCNCHIDCANESKSCDNATVDQDAVGSVGESHDWKVESDKKDLKVISPYHLLVCS